MPTEIMNAYQFLLVFVVCSGATVVLLQADSRTVERWAIGRELTEPQPKECTK